jgi:WD domain, G-beta repeat
MALPPDAIEIPPDAIELRGNTKTIYEILALPSGNRIITACLDRALRVFSATTGEVLRTYNGHRSNVIGALAALGGDVVASCDGAGDLRVWDVSTGETFYSASLRRRYLQYYSLVALNVDMFVVGAGAHMYFYSHNSGRDVSQIHSLEDAHASCVMNMAAHSNLLVTASSDRTVVVWRASSIGCQKVVLLGTYANAVVRVAMGALRIVTGATDAEIRVYDSKTFQCMSVHTSFLNSMAMSFVLVGEAHALAIGVRALHVIEITSGRVLESIVLPYSGVSCGVSQDGWLVVGGDRGDSTLFPPSPTAAAIFRDAIAARRRERIRRVVNLAKVVTDERP